MVGVRNGVTKQISDEEPRAVYSLCYDHALTLAAKDTIKQNKILRDTLDTAFEVSKLLKLSPLNDVLFFKLKNDISPSTSGFCTVCPTRWTLLAASLNIIL